MSLSASPLLPFLLSLLFDTAQIALGVAALASASRLAARRGAAVTGGLLVLAAGLLQITVHVLGLMAPNLMISLAMPVATFQMLVGIAAGVSALLLAAGIIVLVLAATRAPERTGHPMAPGR